MVHAGRVYGDDGLERPAKPSGRAARRWIAAFLLVLGVFGFGQLEAWPFTSWYMFSHVEPAIDRVAQAVAVAPDGSERVVRSGLPAGLVAHRLRQRLERGNAEDGARVCASLLDLARTQGPVATVRIEERSWDPLVRDGDRPARITTTVIAVCR